MRFLEEQPSGLDKQVMIPVFKVNVKELHIIKSLLYPAIKHTPVTIETQSTVARMKNISRVISRYLDSKPRPDADGAFEKEDLE